MNNFPEYINTALVVGLGSIGKRHIKILKEIYPDIKIIVLRHRRGVEKLKDVEKTVYDLKEALNYNPDIALICNPSSKHLEVALPLVELGIHLLIEKPISSKSEKENELITLSKKNNCKILVGYNLKFLDSLNAFKEEIEKGSVGQVLSIRAEVGQHLSSWREDKNYLNSVSAKKELGGGVLLELSHEFDYLKWIFGKVNWVFGYTTRVSSLEVDVEDLSHCLICFKKINNKKNIVANISLDFFRRDPVRNCIVIGEKGSLRWDGINNSVEIYLDSKKIWSTVYKKKRNKDYSYKQQLIHFIECIKGDAIPITTVESAFETLRLIEGIKKSSIEKKPLSLEI
jgi:predicted dehydrogenase